jgi:hypothetical protein
MTEITWTPNPDGEGERATLEGYDMGIAFLPGVGAEIWDAYCWWIERDGAEIDLGRGDTMEEAKAAAIAAVEKASKDD